MGSRASEVVSECERRGLQRSRDVFAIADGLSGDVAAVCDGVQVREMAGGYVLGGAFSRMTVAWCGSVVRVLGRCVSSCDSGYSGRGCGFTVAESTVRSQIQEIAMQSLASATLSAISSLNVRDGYFRV